MYYIHVRVCTPVHCRCKYNRTVLRSVHELVFQQGEKRTGKREVTTHTHIVSSNLALTPLEQDLLDGARTPLDGRSRGRTAVGEEEGVRC